jgi:hypothetical protein
MFRELLEYEPERVNGNMSSDSKKEIQEILQFLTVFSLGYSEFMGRPKGNFENLLNVWVIKMTKWGWICKKLLIQIHNFYKLAVKFSRVKKYNYDMMNVSLSIERLEDKGRLIIGGDLRNDTQDIEAEQILTNSQLQYYKLFEEGLSNAVVAVRLDKTLGHVERMRNELKKRLN